MNQKNAAHGGTAIKTKAKVFVVDDHPVVRQGLAQLINQELDLKVCGEAQTVQDALKLIPPAKPDLVIIDLSLKGKSGIELIKDLQVREPNLPLLVLSMLDETFYAERVLRAGAKGYIMKEEAPESLLTAIRRVLGGEVYLSDNMSSKMLRKFVAGRPETLGSPIDRLSDRELEVFQAIGHGMKTSQIAEDMHLSVKTIESYREHLKEKLALGDAAELLQHAILWVKSQSG